MQKFLFESGLSGTPNAFFGHHMHEFLFQAGQPREVCEDFCVAMGIDPGAQGTGMPPPAARFGVALKQDEQTPV